MKTRTLGSLLAAAALWLGSITVTQAQEPVSTGTILGLAPQAGILTLRSDQTSRPITFYGMERANIFTADGKVATVADLTPGMQATIQYAVRGKRWYISKVLLLAEERSAPIVSIPVDVNPALRTRAANDGDITTQPGSKAAIDNDITTQPGSSRGETGRVPVRRRNP